MPHNRDGWMDGWVDGWVKGWVKGCRSFLAKPSSVFSRNRLKKIKAKKPFANTIAVLKAEMTRTSTGSATISPKIRLAHTLSFCPPVHAYAWKRAPDEEEVGCNP